MYEFRSVFSAKNRTYADSVLSVRVLHVFRSSHRLFRSSWVKLNYGLGGSRSLSRSALTRTRIVDAGNILRRVSQSLARFRGASINQNSTNCSKNWSVCRSRSFSFPQLFPPTGLRCPGLRTEIVLFPSFRRIFLYCPIRTQKNSSHSGRAV